MGASNSRPEEDKSLKLCRDRKKYVKKALECRCVLAEAHFIYIQSLRNTGRALLEFFEPEGLKESDLHDSTDANKGPLVPNEERSNGSNSQKNEEEIVASPVAERVTVPNSPNNTKRHPNETHEPVSAPSPPPAETLPWDYFDLSLQVDVQISSRKINGYNEGLEHEGETRTTLNAEDERNANEPIHNIFESEDSDEINFVLERKDFNESDEDFDEPLSEGINMVSDAMGAPSSPSIASASTEIPEIFPLGRSRSPELSPLREIAPSVSEPVNLTKLTDIEETDIEENIVESNASPKDLYPRMKDIEQLFFEASECGHEVLRMLEADKFQFRRLLPKQKGESKISWCLIACFSHQEESNQVSEEPNQASKRYLMGKRNMSARSFSSMHVTASASQNPRDGALANSGNDIYCMISGSHASTLERLYAWEKKLYNEVKASQVVRRQYDLKCKLLRHQEYKAQSAKKVDKTRAVIKDLHSRIRVYIKRMETISRKIKQIRDLELQPQFEELIKGLGNMWQKMHEFHKLQFDIISAALSNPTEIAINSENRQLLSYHLEQQLSLTSSNYSRSIAAYQSYLKEIEGWLLKCILFPEKSSKNTSKHQPMSIGEYAQPIFLTCNSWLDGLEKLAAENSRLSPHQDKHHNENLGNTDNPVNENDNMCKSLVQFFSQLKTFSESSANMYKELDKSIQEANIKYEKLQKTQPS